MRNDPVSDAKRYETLKRQLAELPPIRRGSLVRRFMPCGKPGCRCQASPPQLHGPYYQWTRKVRGKTTTVRVNEAQAKLLREWIGNRRRLDQIVRQMENVSTRLTDKMLHAARKR
jgi:hypothetical protein